MVQLGWSNYIPLEILLMPSHQSFCCSLFLVFFWKCLQTIRPDLLTLGDMVTWLHDQFGTSAKVPELRSCKLCPITMVFDIPYRANVLWRKSGIVDTKDTYIYILPAILCNYSLLQENRFHIVGLWSLCEAGIMDSQSLAMVDVL